MARKTGLDHDDLTRRAKKIAEIQDKRERMLENERYMPVVKANSLIQKNRYELSAREQKIVLYLISKIKPEAQELKTIELSLNEFCKITGIDNFGGGYYKEIKETVKALRDKSMYITVDDDREVLVSWVNKAAFSKSKGNIEIRLDDDLIPYLLNVKKFYTAYALSNVISMNSKYGIRLYELLKSYANRRHIKFEIDELKRLLCAEKYENITNFKKKVIEPALNDIEKYADIKVSVIYHKQKNKFTHIEFVITDISGTDEYYTKMDLLEQERAK